MSVFLRSIRYLFMPIVIVFSCIAVAQYYEHIWLVWMPTITELPLYLLSAAALLALQFNCTRITYLALLQLSHYLLEHGDMVDASLIKPVVEPIFLAGTFIIMLFAITRDRALFSVYSIKIIFGIVLCFAIAFGSLAFIPLINQPSTNTLPTVLELLTPMQVPIGIATLVTCISCVLRGSRIDSTITVTLFIWLFHFYLPTELPLALLLCLLALVYLLAILCESHQLAYRDDLTGLYSRRALNTMAPSLNSHYSVAMVDIDHFKKFNDNFGHDIGDQVLRLVACKLNKVKGGGKVYRYGGEEFTIVFPNKDVEEIMPHLEEIRIKVRDYKIAIRNDSRMLTSKSNRKESAQIPTKSANITISISVSEHHGESTFEQTLKRADKALYIAKKNGRNRVFA